MYFHLSIRTIPAILLFMLMTFAMSPTEAQNTKKSADLQSHHQDPWKTVDSLMKKSLPQSALEITLKIYQDAKENQDYPEMIRAIIYNIEIRSTYEEDFLKMSIKILQEELGDQNDTVAKALLESMLADLYMQYYYQNRWNLLDRSDAGPSSGDDIALWDSHRLMEAITTHHLNSLTHDAVLKREMLKSYDRILIREENSKLFRPTLYDFLAHRALDFFKQNMYEENPSMPPSLAEDPRLFSSPAIFARWDLFTRDTALPGYHALKIYRDLTLFHLNDSRPDALIELTLDRLTLLYRENESITGHPQLYLDQLEQLAQTYEGNAMYPWIVYHMALWYRDQSNNFSEPEEERTWYLKKARDLCADVLERMPKGVGSGDCAALITSIENQRIELTLQEVQLPGQPLLYKTDFKNADTLYYRMIKISKGNWDAIQSLPDRQDRAAALAALQPLSEWKVITGDPGDYFYHSFEYGAPPPPDFGHYCLIASLKPDFNQHNNILEVAEFQVSDIAYAMRGHSENGSITLVLTDRETGEPLSGFKAQVFAKEYNNEQRKYIHIPFGEYISDKTGMITIHPEHGQTRSKSLDFVFSGPKGDTLYSNNYFSIYGYQRNRKTEQVDSRIFLDRQIYRPGQTLHFKGILFSGSGHDYRVLPNREVEVKLRDNSGSQRGVLSLKTNEFGSYHGSFVLPLQGLTGSWSLESDYSYNHFLVEEYKRPKFEVITLPLSGAYQPGDVVTAEGVAKAFAGFGVGDAEVKWRVTRRISYPYRGWYPWHLEEEVPLDQGDTITDSDGKFRIHFTATPDLQVSPKSLPVFLFTIYIEVTDLNGETQVTESTFKIGYTTLLLSADIPDEISKDQELIFKAQATNLSDQPLEVAGRWVLYMFEERALQRTRPWTDPDLLVMNEKSFRASFPLDPYWPADTALKRSPPVASGVFSTGSDGRIDLNILRKMGQGRYLLIVESEDPTGEKVSVEREFLLYDTGNKKVPEPALFYARLLESVAEPGETIRVLVGSSLKSHVLMSVEVHGQIIEERWITLQGKQQLLTIPVQESYRGGVAIHLLSARLNRAFAEELYVVVPYSNKKIDIKLATFRDHLKPGEKEEYRVTITGSQGERVIAELLSGMYDASLDAFSVNSWNMQIYEKNSVFRDWNMYSFDPTDSYDMSFLKNSPVQTRNQQFDALDWKRLRNWGWGGGLGKGLYFRDESFVSYTGSDDISYEDVPEGVYEVILNKEPAGSYQWSFSPVSDTNMNATSTPQPAIAIRRNFQETAFFYPNLKTDAEGNVVFGFTMPESVTRWKLMMLAHTGDMRLNYTEKMVETRKELMVTPNPPRFLREQDHMVFTSKVTNLSDSAQLCRVKLMLTNGINSESLDRACGNKIPEQEILLKPGESGVVSWNLYIPEQTSAITYRVTGESEIFSDGEERTLPVLTNRMLITESMPLPMTGQRSKDFRMDKLIHSDTSTTIKHHRLTLEYTSNPAWYAIQALPYLMEFPHECSEQLFSRFYANTLASHIIHSHPGIKQVFDNWKMLTPNALRSNLEKNNELKSLMLEETPWLVEGADESERKQRAALLFDLNRMAGEQEVILRKLKDQQLSNGGWPWFKGGPDNLYITQHIITGIGRLRETAVFDYTRDPASQQMTEKGIRYLDARILERYINLQERYRKEPKELEKDHLGALEIQYLYARSRFLKDFPLDEKVQPAFDYFQEQAVRFWPDKNLMMQGYLALALNSLGDKPQALLITKSIRERSLWDEEAGRYWRSQPGYYWYEAPIERQALMIEVFAGVTGDMVGVEEMKTWLLKQKQTQNWASTKATADACYALLLRGSDMLEPNPVRITLGSKTLDPFQEGSTHPEAGTGYVKMEWNGEEIIPTMGQVKVTATSAQTSWGALYWQYFEQLDRITPHATPLQIEKQLFVEESTPQGLVIRPLRKGSTLQVGDKIVVRITLKVDRDLEYVHLKDMRAAAFEPLTTLSGYRWKGGLGYYESPRDAAMNFFFDRIPKGTYLFEYKLFATHAGEFSNGITTVQCMYAPEFTSHSEGIRVEIHE